MNHQYNEELTRAAFWLEIATQLSGFERLVHKTEHLSPMDKETLKKIKTALSESNKLADQQRRYHSRQLERIRRSYLNEH